MVSIQQSVLIVATIAALASSAYALTCYQCQSIFDERCNDPYAPEDIYKLDCFRVSVPKVLQSLLPIKNATGCMKTATEVNGARHVVRACYYGDVKSTANCQTDTVPFFNQISCDVCTGNLCNSSTANGPIAVIIGVFAAVARMLY